MASAIRYILHNTPFDNDKIKLNRMPCILILCVFSDVRLYGALGGNGMGGNALFASLFQLKDLWYNDIIITQLLEKIVDKCENPPGSITMLVLTIG